MSNIGEIKEYLGAEIVDFWNVFCDSKKHSKYLSLWDHEDLFAYILNEESIHHGTSK